MVFARDASQRITSIKDPAGKAMTYAYDTNGDLTSFTDRALAITQFGYSPNHYLDLIQDPLGRQAIRNEYDAAGRLLWSTDALGQKVTYGHSLAANQEQVTDRLGHVTLYEYDERGDITRKTDATGAVRSYTFDVRGNKLSETDPLGRTSSMTYDGANNMLTETDALGHVTAHTYNQFGQLVTTTDPLGHVTTSEWDGPNLKSRDGRPREHHEVHVRLLAVAGPAADRDGCARKRHDQRLRRRGPRARAHRRARHRDGLHVRRERQEDERDRSSHLLERHGRVDHHDVRVRRDGASPANAEVLQRVSSADALDDVHRDREGGDEDRRGRPRDGLRVRRARSAGDDDASGRDDGDRDVRRRESPDLEHRRGGEHDALCV